MGMAAAHRWAGSSAVHPAARMRIGFCTGRWDPWRAAAGRSYAAEAGRDTATGGPDFSQLAFWEQFYVDRHGSGEPFEWFLDPRRVLTLLAERGHIVKGQKDIRCAGGGARCLCRLLTGARCFPPPPPSLLIRPFVLRSIGRATSAAAHPLSVSSCYHKRMRRT